VRNRNGHHAYVRILLRKELVCLWLVERMIEDKLLTWMTYLADVISVVIWSHSIAGIVQSYWLSVCTWIGCLWIWAEGLVASRLERLWAWWKLGMEANLATLLGFGPWALVLGTICWLRGFCFFYFVPQNQFDLNPVSITICFSQHFSFEWNGSCCYILSLEISELCRSWI